MERNTLITLAELKPGDRYRFPGKDEAWEIVSLNGPMVLTNMPGLNDKFIYSHHVQKKSSLQVIYLRHFER